LLREELRARPTARAARQGDAVAGGDGRSNRPGATTVPDRIDPSAGTVTFVPTAYIGRLT
jgi:hypothetical protein